MLRRAPWDIALYASAIVSASLSGVKVPLVKESVLGVDEISCPALCLTRSAGSCGGGASALADALSRLVMFNTLVDQSMSGVISS